MLRCGSAAAARRPGWAAALRCWARTLPPRCAVLPAATESLGAALRHCILSSAPAFARRISQGQNFHGKALPALLENSMFAEGDILIANFGLHHGSSTVSLPAQGAEAGSCDGCNEQPFSHACPCALYLPCLPLIAGRKLVLSARSTKRCLKALPPITSRMSAVCHGHSGSRRLRSTLTHPTVNTTEASRPSSATPSGASSSCRRAELGPHSLGAAPWARKLGHYLLRCARWRHAACRLQRKQPIICHLPSPSPCVSAFAAQGNGTMELEPGFTDKYGLQQGLWRNKAADAVMRSAGIPLIQSFNESVPMWRAHRDNGQGYECTHPCHPSLSQASLGGGGGPSARGGSAWCKSTRCRWQCWAPLPQHA